MSAPSKAGVSKLGNPAWPKVSHNNERLHSAIGYITPSDKLQGRAEMIQTQRDAKLAAARYARKTKRQAS